MIFILPKNPSVNHLYGYTCQRGFARSYITKEGKNWFETAGLLLKTQWDKKTISGPCVVRVALFTSRRQDVDNILKPILDLLQKTQVLTNDDQVVRLTVTKDKCMKADEKIVVEVTALDKTTKI